MTMSRPEEYLRLLGVVNDRMWAQIEPLEKQLRSLDAEYQAASRRPVVDVVSRGAAALLTPKIDTVAAKLNQLYDEWKMLIVNLGPAPPVAKSAGDWTNQIPWPKAVPPEVKRYVLRMIDQGGVPLSKRVTVKAGTFPYGGGGLVIEYGKW
jgi:hypothetical protein